MHTARDAACRVSVIIRSMGRPELAEALASVGAQDYPNIEVVLVDALGGLSAPSSNGCGRFPINFVPGTARRLRPVAANAGLAAAGGDLLTFLDEDDLFEAGHVAGLVQALDARTDCIAAYSITREIDRQGRVLRVRAQPFARFLLFCECYLHFGSVLFRREALASCRFDEQFELCEDWDFWLQVSRLGPFVLVPNETAVYRAERGESGMGGASTNRDVERARPYVERLAAKWAEDARAAGRDLDVRFTHALELMRARKLDAAAIAVEGMLAIFPYHAGALCLRGNLLCAQGRFDQALRDFQRAAREDPADAAHWIGAARALERLDRPQEAIACYERALQAAPALPDIAARLADLRKRNVT